MHSFASSSNGGLATDGHLEKWTAEIKLRAQRRIGGLARYLDKAKPLKGRGASVASGGQTKAAAIKGAGLSVRTVARYEELVGPPGAACSTSGDDGD